MVVGAALAGGGAGVEAEVDPAAVSPTLSVIAAPTAAVRPSGSGASDDVVVTWPAGPNQVIVTRDLVVRGHVRDASWRVQALLQSRSAEPIVVRTGGPMTLPGDRERSPGRTFRLTLPLPDPRPSGPAVLQVVAYDATGRAQAVVLHPIHIGALPGPATGADTGQMARCHLPGILPEPRRRELAAPGC